MNCEEYRAVTWHRTGLAKSEKWEPVRRIAPAENEKKDIDHIQSGIPRSTYSVPIHVLEESLVAFVKMEPAVGVEMERAQCQ